MVEKYLKSNLCHLPWTSIETRPDGKYTPCCLYKEQIEDGQKKYNTVDHTVSDAQNSEYMNRLRKSFIAGEKPKGCQACWKEEQSGKTSKRQNAWIKMPIIGEGAIKKNTVAPHFIDMKLGNICNLKCRICSPYASSQITPEFMKMDPHNKEHWRKQNRLGMWPRAKNSFLDGAEEWLQHVRYFEITGGEPLMIEKQFDVLKKCIDIGVANKIDLHYNTNGTQYPEEAVREIWPKFKRVELAFSIDDIERRFEYQRKNAKWDTVNENIIKYKNSGMKNLQTQICTTINIFNIMHLDELAVHVDRWSPDYWHINVLHWPVEFDVQGLGNDIKQVITKKLSGCKLYKDELASAINYLNQESKDSIIDLEEMRNSKIKLFDKFRRENFKDVFPELNELLRVYE